MKRIGIVVNVNKDIGYKYTQEVVDSIIKNGGTFLIEDYILKNLSGIKPDISCKTEKDIFKNSDVVICIGGDGTLLRLAREMPKDRRIPIVGINLGTMGFLTEIDKNDIDNSIKKIINNKYTLQKRMMLDLKIVRGNNKIENEIALNDIVISRVSISRVLHIKNYINDRYMDSYPGDGMIIATPSGSTAYSLSAGGPIVEPEAELIISTPICPHILYSRSYIATSDKEFKILIDPKYDEEAVITVDGQKCYNIERGDLIFIKKSSIYTYLINLEQVNCFDILRKKIMERNKKLI